MNITEIVFASHKLIGHPKPNQVLDAILYVQETTDPDIKGLTAKMADALQARRVGGHVFIGSDSHNYHQCYSDAQILLARVLLDRSSHGSMPSYVTPQLNNTAYYIWEREHKKNLTDNPVDNWNEAQRRYVKDGLNYLVGLQSPVSFLL